MTYALIISPAKTMQQIDDIPHPTTSPVLLDKTRELLGYMKALSLDEAQKLWNCSDKLAALNFERFQNMDLSKQTPADVTAACITYEGIQYQHLAAAVLAEHELAWLQNHLRILSGFYGVLRPLDGVVPYRLEMQARFTDARPFVLDATSSASASSHGNSCRSDSDSKRANLSTLYEFWGTCIARELAKDFSCIVNCASQEYAKAVKPYVADLGIEFVTCNFFEEKNGKRKQLSTAAKTARGSFVRWCAEQQISNKDELMNFSELDYCFDPETSNERELNFVK